MSVTVDEILQRMIVDARNLDPTINITKGTETYIRFACTASAIWGLYKQDDWTLDQIFPETMSVDSLNRYAATRGLNVDGLAPAEILTFILSYIRKPASGGKPTDYERWALEASSQGKCIMLQVSMIRGNFSNMYAKKLLEPHDCDGVGFDVFSGDAGKSIVIDLGDTKPLIGLGLGFSTTRHGTLNIYKDNGEESFEKIGEIEIAFGWCQLNFESTDISRIKIEAQYVEPLQDWQQESLNSIKCTGIEVYEASDVLEAATSAQCLKNYNGIGTVMLLVSPVSLSMRCCEAIRTKCEDEGPVAPKEIYVNVPTESVISLRVSARGSAFVEDSFRTDVKKYFASLKPGDMFITAQILIYVIKNGGDDATIEVSQNGGAYQEQTSPITSGPMEQFVLGELEVQ